MNLTTRLYPLSFAPLKIPKVWGCEYWLLSALENEATAVKQGYLQDNDLQEIISVYLADILGEKLYEKYGEQFPVLIKILEVDDFLSVQVHPSDELAYQYYRSYGKSEMWYVNRVKPGGRIYLGFKRDMNASEFYRHCREGSLDEVLNVVTPKAGECYFIPAGTPHACGGGLVITEIQEASDITYRIYDWNRENDPATRREMHIEAALECMNFRAYSPSCATAGKLASCEHFTVNLLQVKQPIPYTDGDYKNNFVIYAGIRGDSLIRYEGGDYLLKEGECILIPAILDRWELRSKESESAVLEVFIETV